jgi:GTP-binding protein YchF
MALSIGIVGLPNVGKSTLFNALTKKSVPAMNYPFCTIDPSVGVVGVPDARLYKIAEFTGSKKVLPAAIEFVDIAGLVEGASKGEGLGNKFLANIRETDAVLEMVRIFPVEGGDKDIQHVYGNIDPLRDMKVINMELALADLETLEKRAGAISREVKRGDKEFVALNDAIQKVKAVVELGGMAYEVTLNEEEEKKIKELNLLTRKKFLYGLNKKSGVKNLDETDPEKFKELTKSIEATGASWVLLDAKTEDELKELSDDEKTELRADLGINESGVDHLIVEAYKLLGLETYFTTGPEETRAWTIKAGSTAPVAGMAIHTDFKDKFIRAEVVFWQDLLDAGSMADARAKGKVRTEGKTYIVKDGDVVEFKI